MRLHSLRVTAFGAFAGSESVDFDALGAGGLFLLHGDTGAGKTTLLDAVCFALYGEVPGARAREMRLRSDHADVDTRTEVELEVSLRERRLRIVRRPKQSRPRLRGEGMTEEAHACTVEELHADGSTSVMAARPDEARAELADLLGMSCDQFCQVVLLPQGEFASFLRADSDKRREVLERLFATQRFADVERWLTERRKAARGELEGVLRDVRDIVSRLAQAAGEDPPAEWEAEPAGVREWVGRLIVTIEAGAATAQEASVTARAERAAAERALAAATELASRQRQHAEAVGQLAQWEASRPARDAAERELLAARGAGPVAPLLTAAHARGTEAAAA
ncbi:MAG: repair exonuclease, SbcC, partial [Conexibacter sp.]|nr:repair exonuclease, SbcC [Conexibacter sp.]